MIDAFLAAVKDVLARGDGIELRGFGTFKVRHHKARKAHNPRTGEPVEVRPAACQSSNPCDSPVAGVDGGHRFSVDRRPAEAIGKQ